MFTIKNGAGFCSFIRLSLYTLDSLGIEEKRFVCLYTALRLAQEFFKYMDTSPLLQNIAYARQ
jgi:hypothetical protein